jgi:hypothetical protein
MTIRMGVPFLDVVTFGEIPLPLLEVASPIHRILPEYGNRFERAYHHGNNAAMMTPRKTGRRV